MEPLCTAQRVLALISPLRFFDTVLFSADTLCVSIVVQHFRAAGLTNCYIQHFGKMDFWNDFRLTSFRRDGLRIHKCRMLWFGIIMILRRRWNLEYRMLKLVLRKLKFVRNPNRKYRMPWPNLFVRYVVKLHPLVSLYYGHHLKWPRNCVILTLWFHKIIKSGFLQLLKNKTTPQKMWIVHLYHQLYIGMSV